ncbi:MAG: hypothetical protein VX730_07875 [Pseudomonadota bacterium]|nr:hypothetical protein [Pseudomonadota bacterium]
MNMNLAKAENFLGAAQMAVREASKALKADNLAMLTATAEAALGLFSEVKNMIVRGEVSAEEIATMIGMPAHALATGEKGLKGLEDLIERTKTENPGALIGLNPLAEAMRTFLELARG